MLEFQKVVKKFPSPGGKDYVAVSDLSFTIGPGECCCLLGPNGAGKTTSIMMMLGFTPLDSGAIMVCGNSVMDNPIETRKRISYIPDEVALYQNLTGIQNLQFFDELIKGKRRSRDEYVDYAKTVSLNVQQLERRLFTYSKGMKQRLAIAVSLLKDASIYVFDEPTNGLDAVGVKELIEILLKLREMKKAILVTTHDLLHVSAFANKVLFLQNGKISRQIVDPELKTLNLETEYIRMIQFPT